MGIRAEGVSVDFGKVQEWKGGIVKKLTGGVGGLLKGNKVEILSGEVLFISSNEVRVVSGYDSARYRFVDCIIATGSRPIELKTFPFGGRILDSTAALSLDHVPESLIVIGGGYIGIELGQTFSKFGSKLTILEGSDAILPGFEKEFSSLVAKKLQKTGAVIETGALAKSAQASDKAVTVTYTVNGEERQATAEYVLVTVGRRPNTDELGLDMLDMKLTDRGYIEVDEKGQTSVPHIYAIGDIVAGPALAHKASYEGKVAAEAIAGHPSVVDYKALPAVVFSDPEIAGVGLSETEAKKEGYETATGKFPYAANGRALSLGSAEGFVKVVADKKTGLVLGAQVVGPEASNLIAEMGLAIEMGATLEDIALTIHAHPTLAEMVMEAAEGALGQAIHQINK
ncbi:Dihydrolipoyl dehydrogenase [compost metagenome]